jgi:uncharacterized membrane protein (UPF0127 family)
MRYRVQNLTRNTLLADRMEEASTFLARLKGLMGVTDFPFGRALHIVPCSSIHTFFMRLPIDVLFLDPKLEVLDLQEAMLPWRTSRIYFQARSVLELPAGCLRASHTQVGDRLAFEPS